MACHLATEPCTIETRHYARVDRWNVVCLPVQDGWQWCAVWPTPPSAPSWVGDMDAMRDSGVVMKSYRICHETDVTDVPVWAR